MHVLAGEMSHVEASGMAVNSVRESLPITSPPKLVPAVRHNRQDRAYGHEAIVKGAQTVASGGYLVLQYLVKDLSFSCFSMHRMLKN